MDAEFDGIVDGLENCVTLDGQTTPSANLPMGAFRHTNVGAATSRSHYGRVAEIQDGTIWKAASPGGTGDAMTGTVTPAPSAYTAGMVVQIIAPGTNTVTTPTININSLGAKTIRKHQAALVAGDITSGDTLWLVYDGTYFEYINPKLFNIDLNSLTTDATGGAMTDLIPFVDASGSNSSDKVTVQDFLTNVMANMTADTTGGATGDKLIFSDASESNAAQTVTADNFIANSLQLLSTQSAALSDLVPFVDASNSNIGAKATWTTVFSTVIGSVTDTTPALATDYEMVARKTSDGTLHRPLLSEIGVGKQTIWVPAAAMTSRTTNGAASGTTESTTNKVMNKTLDFDTTTQEFAQFTVAFPKGWNEGTVTFIPFWTAASGSGGVVWGLQGVALSNDDAIDTAFGTAQTSTDTLIAALDVHVGPESSAITIAGTPAVGDICYFQINRTVSDGSDTLGVDAKLIGIQLLYTTNSNVDD